MAKVLALLSSAAVPLSGTSAPSSPLAVDYQGRASAMLPHTIANQGIPHERNDQWAQLSVFGGDVADVAASPTQPGVVLAGIASSSGFGGALYRSEDGGSTWQRIEALAGYAVFDVAFGTDGSAYVGTSDGLWLSHDDGVTWARTELGIGKNDSIMAVTVHPNDASVIWVGVSETYGEQPVNLLKSVDGGFTWTNRTPPGNVPMTVRAIAVDPLDTAIVWAALGGDFGGGGVWTSTDGGQTWIDRSAGLPDVPMHAISYADARVLVGGGQLYDSQHAGLFASNDEGGTWTALHDATWPMKVVTDLAVQPGNPNMIFAATDGMGINRSEDGGATWAIGVGGSGTLSARSVHIVSGDGSEILLGVTSLGVYRSTNGGSDFSVSTTGIS